MSSDRNFRLITHTDLDGVGCEIVFKAHFGWDKQVDMAENTEVDEKVKSLLEEDTESFFIITDLSVSKEVAKWIDDNHKGRVRLIDHHKTALWLNEYDWAMVVEGKCATKLFYDDIMEQLRDEIFGLQGYSTFVEVVNDYDMWIHSHTFPKILNTLYYLIGRKDFVLRMKLNKNMFLSTNEELLIKVEERNKQEYLKKKVKQAKLYKWDMNGNNVAFVFADRYQSELGEYLLKELGVQVVAMADCASQKVSLRSVKELDVSVFAKEKGGGGHPNSCGYPITDEHIERVIVNTVF